MDLSQIFLETGESKVSTAKMPDSVSEWDDFMNNEVIKQNKQLTGKKIKLDYTKLNEEARTGVGSFTVKNSEGKKIMNIPFVIKSGELSPLDMFYKPRSSDPMPLSKDRIREVFFKASISNGLSPYPNNGAITDDGFSDFSPYQDYGDLPGPGIKYASEYFDVESAVRESLKTSPPEITGMIEKAARERFARVDEELDDKSNAIYLHLLKDNGLTGVLGKMAMHEPHAALYENISNASSAETPPISTARIVKVAGNNYSCYFSYLDGSKSKSSKLTIKEAGLVVSSLGKDPAQEMNMIERSGQRIISSIRGKEKSDEVSLIEDMIPEQWTTLKKDDTVKVNVFEPATGAALSGYAFGTVYGPDGKKTSKSLFMKPGFHYSYQDSISVEYIEGGLKEKRVGKLEEIEPDVGKKAVYKFGKDGESKITIPFKILRVVKKGRYSKPELQVELEDGSIVLLKSSYSVSNPTKASAFSRKPGMLYDLERLKNSEDFNSTYLIPSNSILIGLGESVKLSSTPKEKSNDEILNKTASVHSVQITDNDNGGLFLRSPDPSMLKTAMSEWGYDPNNMSDIEAMHLLVSHGSDPSSTERAIGLARDIGRSEFMMEKISWNEDLEVKVASEKWKVIEKGFLEVSDEIWGMNILKMAATSGGDKNSVSNILQLRMVGPETYRDFLKQLPKAEKTMSFLCSLLIASRISGDLNLDESEVASSIKGLDSIISKVKEMRPLANIQ